MAFTETTSESWFGRIFESIKSVLLGLILFGVAFPILFWNEGRAVHTARSLEEGAAVVISVPADSVNPVNDGKLVHVTGDATTSETLTDPDFGVAVPAIHLERVAEMYQWQEKKTSQSRNKLGGGKETVTTYDYAPTWSAQLIDSSSFKESGHANPRTMPVESTTFTAKKVTLGAFTLADSQIAKINKSDAVALDDSAAAKLPDAMKSRVTLRSGGYYMGKDPATPAVGDVRISFKAVHPATVSLVARQVASSFEPYHAKAGNTIELLTYGTVAADSMFKSAEQANATLAWILRGAGFLMMWFGLFLTFRPIAVFGDVVPLFGSIIAGGIGIGCFLIALFFSVITIAIGWITYRPLVGISLLVIAALAVAGMIKVAKGRPSSSKSTAASA